jgi:hypothetical protein
MIYFILLSHLHIKQKKNNNRGILSLDVMQVPSQCESREKNMFYG